MKTILSTVLAMACATGWVTAADKSGPADRLSAEDIEEFFIRRTVKDVKDTPYYNERDRDILPRRSLCIQFGQPGSYESSGFLLASGDWMK